MSRPRQSGPTADRPSCPVIGERYFDTDLGNSVEWDGSTWNSMGGGGGGGAPTSTVGAIQVDDGAGGWSSLAHSGGGADEYPYGPAGGGTVAFRAGVPAGDVTPAGGAGQDIVPVGATVAATAAPAAGWSSTGPYATMLNAMFPLPVGAWYEKL